jgi:N6-L-threonylcarbamoyladenine synthase
LSTKIFMASRIRNIPRVVVCGGVAANQALRDRVVSEGKNLGIEVIFPSIGLCADNAAMIGARGYSLVRAGKLDSLDFGAMSRW